MSEHIVQEIRDPATAKAVFVDLVAEHPAAMSVLASNADGLIVNPSRYENPRWWAMSDSSGRVVAAFMHTPPMPLHVALATPEQAMRLADLLATQGYSLPGVGGTRPPAEAFARTWHAHTGCTPTVQMALGDYDLPGVPAVPFDVPGELRWATAHDQPLIDDWSEAFARDAHVARAERTDWSPTVRAGRLALWTVDAHPVSMCLHSLPNGGVVRVSGVYTPHERRGHGYASAVVAALSAHCQNLGLTCMLYTDLANPTSNGIYQGIGYRRIGDSITISFEGGTD